MKAQDKFTFWQSVQYYALLSCGFLLSLLGFRCIKHLGNLLGVIMWYIVPSRRELALKNIKERLELSDIEAEKIARASFKHTARSFLEITLTHKFSFNPQKTTLTINNPELFDLLKNTERAVVASTAHFGSWELLASLLGELYSSPRPRMVVVRRYPNPAIQAFIASCREVHGATMVGHRAVAVNVLRALKQKGIVAFLVDHNALSHEALFMDFLGKEAAVNMGPALLAVRAEALIMPIFLLRSEKGYIFHLEPPLDTKELTGTREEKVLQATQFYTQAVEKCIKQYPEQWFWLHNRWKKRDKN